MQNYQKRTFQRRRFSRQKWQQSSTSWTYQSASTQLQKRTIIGNRELACGQKSSKTMRSGLLTSISKTLYSLVMQLVDKQVTDNRRISHVQTGMASVLHRVAELLTTESNFADNVGIKFHTPEEFFLGKSARPFVRTFEPAEYVASASTTTRMSIRF